MKYKLYIDLSSSNSGICLYNPATHEVNIGEINLKSLKKPTQLKEVDYQKVKFGLIKEALDNLCQRFDIGVVCLEGIFIQPKFLKSSEMLLKLHGFVMYHFLDKEVIYISPSEVKKAISGKGNTKKDVLKTILEEHYSITFKNNDQSDAFALCVTDNGWLDYQIKEM